MARSRLLALAATGVALVAGGAVAVGADHSITADPSAANPSAHNGEPVWSRVDSSGRGRLVQRVGGRNEDVRVRPKDGLFDPDLGHNRRGNRVIVYTRCAGVSGRDCDIWELDYGRGGERKLPGASTSRCSEFAPSVWLGKFVYARSGPSGCNGLYVLRRAGNGRKRRLLLDRRVPADTDVRGNRVAYHYSPAGDPSRTFVRIRQFHGPSRVIASGSRGEGQNLRVSSPVLDGAYVYWLHEDRRQRQFVVARNRVTDRRSPVELSDRTFPGRPDSLAVTRGLVYFTNGRGLHRATDSVPRFAPRG